MTNLIVELSKYAFIILMALYTYLCFSVLKKKQEGEIRYGFGVQTFLMFLIHLLAYVVIYLQTEQVKVLVFYLLQVFALQTVRVVCQVIYPKINRLVLNNMCLMLSLGFIILTRLSYDRAVRQFQMVAVSLVIFLVIPVLIRKCGFLQKLPWVYGGIGLLLLVMVAFFGDTSNGAKLSIEIAGFGLQPSEFVKISFVFFTAARLSESVKFRDLVLTTAMAALHVLILVYSRDLGGALLFFITYLVMLYAASKKPFYLLSGLGAGCAAAFAGYRLFAHVRVRVLAWSDPFRVIDNEGYQITQSLFAIGTGGWFGMGLCRGTPGKIPIVDQDFIFSALAEEFGGIFALCLILICMSCFVMFVNIAMQIKNNFYKYTALGLGTFYGFQVFLTIGGAIKFIPSTGVTLPLISYGGSSVVSTIAVFAIIQGMYLLKEDEDSKIGKKRKQTAKAKTKSLKSEEKP